MAGDEAEGGEDWLVKMMLYPYAILYPKFVSLHAGREVALEGYTANFAKANNPANVPRAQLLSRPYLLHRLSDPPGAAATPLRHGWLRRQWHGRRAHAPGKRRKRRG